MCQKKIKNKNPTPSSRLWNITETYLDDRNTLQMFDNAYNTRRVGYFIFIRYTLVGRYMNMK